MTSSLITNSPTRKT